MARYRTPKHTVSVPAKEVLEKRITHAKIAKIRAKLQKKQKNKCPICERNLLRLDATLDHDHKTGYIRATLCRNCNGLIGKLAGILARLDVGKIGFEQIMINLGLHHHPDNLKTKYIHPHAETLLEQRSRRRKRATKLRSKK